MNNSTDIINELKTVGKYCTRAKDKLICHPFTLKKKKKLFIVTKNKETIYSDPIEANAAKMFVSCIKGEL